VLSFRNVDADPVDPVESWPYEALVTALERGLIDDWARVNRAFMKDPWGPVARDVEAYLSYADAEAGVSVLMGELIARARLASEAADRQAVADEVREMVRRSGMSRAAFAAAIGFVRVPVVDLRQRQGDSVGRPDAADASRRRSAELSKPAAP